MRCNQVCAGTRRSQIGGRIRFDGSGCRLGTTDVSTIPAKKWAGILPLPLGEGWGEGTNGSPFANGHTLTLTLSQRERGLPTGVIVGTAVFSHVTNGGPSGRTSNEWHLTDMQRIKHPLPRPPNAAGFAWGGGPAPLRSCTPASSPVPTYFRFKLGPSPIPTRERLHQSVP